ncbi:PBECR4 domain-containing protein [Vallitalea sp.]|jgi:hypothetical protein|uniref:PBECR4 domain-containing protein n=1 Tax=Vallitalea sp. TaxID=1882829 RepID=UPI0025D47323|nr:PBECR4 domain-containing protein [Vallitalea sp.]MCT4686652.1 PBECR4 domain-containing protein [Vallitalea sp.]
MSEISFKERVKNILIDESKAYKQNYVDYEYLICSNAFKIKDSYIIDAKEDNYQHLTGVHSLISPQDFFNKCYNGTLSENDFDFIKRRQSEKSVKGSVRRKIKVLPNMMNIFQKDIMVEETFVKNKVTCAFATTDQQCTLGFVDNLKARPMSLIKGNELNDNKAQRINLLLRKKSDEEKFNEVMIGDLKTLLQYYSTIKNYIDENIIQSQIKTSEDETAASSEIKN